MSDHGRIIPLSADAHIEAYTGYEMFEWSARDYEKDEINTLKNKPGVERVRVLSSRSIRLGNLKARRYVLQFVEKNKAIVIDRVTAIHKGVEYQLILRTPAERYRKDKREYEKVLASWKLIPRIE